MGISQPIGLATRGIPGAPSVQVLTLPSGARRFAKLSDEVIYYYRNVAAEALNDYTDKIALMSQQEVPRNDFDLADSMLAPDNDPGSRATPEDLDAEISYNTSYAAVQHEGEAVMVHRHPIIPAAGGGFFEKVGEPANIVIEWKAQSYTTPGTKSHYLGDPYKAMIPGLEPFVYERVRRAFLG